MPRTYLWGFHIKVIACGKLVIGTSDGGPREIINKNIGILVPLKNTEVLIDAIDYMLDHYQEYSSAKISPVPGTSFDTALKGPGSAMVNPSSKTFEQLIGLMN